MKKDIIEVATFFFNKYESLEDLYEELIIPILKGKELPVNGADWIFEYLTLTKIVSPKDYKKVKELVLEKAEFMNGWGEPNIIKYYDKLDEIIEYLESLELKAPSSF